MTPEERAHLAFRRHALAELQAVHDAGALRAFHSSHKYVLMAYDPQTLRRLGRMVADAPDVAAYLAGFAAATARAPTRGRHVNAAQHIFGYFSGALPETERLVLSGMIAAYGERRLPLGAILRSLRECAVRFEQPYLLAQAYLRPVAAPGPSARPARRCVLKRP